MTVQLDIWKQEPEGDVFIDRVPARTPLDLAREVRQWADNRGLTLGDPVSVWCIRRGRLMVFYASNEEYQEQAACLIEAADVFSGAFRVPTTDECERWRNDPTAEYYVDNYKVHVNTG